MNQLYDISKSESILPAAFHVINNIIDYNKKANSKRNCPLYLQKYTIKECCSRQSQALVILTKLQGHGIEEEEIISLNNFLKTI